MFQRSSDSYFESCCNFLCYSRPGVLTYLYSLGEPLPKRRIQGTQKQSLLVFFLTLLILILMNYQHMLYFICSITKQIAWKFVEKLQNILSQNLGKRAEHVFWIIVPPLRTLKHLCFISVEGRAYSKPILYIKFTV